MFRYRKSKKFGPVRLSLSNSGIGGSVGVKGLRLGISPRGKGYVSTSFAGFSSTQYLTSSSRRAMTPQSKEKVILHEKSHGVIRQQAEVGRVSRLQFDIGIEPYHWLLLFIVFLISIPFLFIPFFIYVGWLVFAQQKVSKARMVVEELEAFASYHQWKELRQALQEQLGRHEGKFKKYIAYSAYQSVILPILEDYQIDDEERALLKALGENIEVNDREVLNEYYYAEALRLFLEDERFEVQEESALEELASVLNLSADRLRKHDKVIGYYKELRKIEEEGLEPIEPSLNIGSPCYLELNAKLMKYKTVRSFTENGTKHTLKSFVEDKAGTLFLTDKGLMFVSGGTSKYLLKNIISLDLHPDDEIIEIILSTRKTPVYLSTGHNLKVLKAVQRLQQDI